MKSGNGISPILAIVLTILVCILTVVFFNGGHVFWGIVFALITVDFLADAILSLKQNNSEAKQ